MKKREFTIILTAAITVIFVLVGFNIYIVQNLTTSLEVEAVEAFIHQLEEYAQRVLDVRFNKDGGGFTGIGPYYQLTFKLNEDTGFKKQRELKKYVDTIGFTAYFDEVLEEMVLTAQKVETIEVSANLRLRRDFGPAIPEPIPTYAKMEALRQYNYLITNMGKEYELELQHLAELYFIFSSGMDPMIEFDPEIRCEVYWPRNTDFEVLNYYEYDRTEPQVEPFFSADYNVVHFFKTEYCTIEITPPTFHDSAYVTKGLTYGW